MAAVIETVSLGRTFGSYKAVDGLDLRVETGEIVGLLGPNGAGKTTTIRMLATLLAPTSGSASVCGFDTVRDPGEVRKRIGYVMQKISPSRNYLTGRQCVEMEASLYHVPRNLVRQRSKEVLDLVGLLPHADKRFNHYSGGMQKRLDLACGLLHRPQLLILDEPSLGLDVQSRHRVWDHIRDLKHEGVTVLLATNYLDEADRLCDRLTIIDQGRAIVAGTPDDLKRSVGADTIDIETNDPEALRGLVERKPWAKHLAVGGDAQLRVHVEDASNALPALMRLAAEAGLVLDRVSYSRPTLDDVFLLHTGRELREEEVPA